jgi:hypothetical protein
MERPGLKDHVLLDSEREIVPRNNTNLIRMERKQHTNKPITTSHNENSEF